MALDIATRNEPGYAVVELRGELDQEAEVLPPEIARLADAGVRAVILDLSQVRMASSMGIGMLVEAYKGAQVAGVRLIFSGLQPQVRTVLTHTKLDTVFEIHDRPEEAAGALGRG